jgi:hypothetical protein
MFIILQAQFEARVPAHAQNDDLSVEGPSFEQFLRSERLHLFIIARHARVFTRSAILAVIAKQERVRLSERTIAGLEKARKAPTPTAIRCSIVP